MLPASGRAVRLLLIAFLAAALSIPAMVTAQTAEASHTPRSAAEQRPTLRLGSRGPAVVYLQQRLQVRPTGYFGPVTRAAVKQLKRRHGWPVNGVVAKRTWGLVFRAKASSSRSARSGAPGTPAFGRAVVATARQTASGARYVYGATGPKSFDCSGFVGSVYRRVGKSLPRTSGAIRGATRYISRSQARPGDLVFVHTGGRVSHVGIVSDRPGYWWEASNPRSGVGHHRAWTSRVSYGRVR